MAVSKVLSIVLLGLCGAALANPVETTTGAPTTPGTGSTTTAYGSTSPAGGAQDYLSDADKAKICEVKPAASNSTTPASVTPASTTPASTTPGLCATTGPADDLCSKLAASVNGTAPCCVASNVCSFKVANATGGSDSTGSTTAGTGTTTAGTGTTTAGTGTTTAGTGTTTAGTGTTTAGTGTTTAGTGTTTAGTGTTTAGTGTTTAGTGTTTAGTGSTTAGPVITPEPNTAYVSCNTAPAGFQQIKACPSGNTIFVYPAGAAGTGSTTIKY